MVRSDSKQLRRRFVDGAWALGARAGQHALKIRTIAEEVGVSTALIYAYFDDKASLLAELRSIGAQHLTERLERAVEGAPAHDKLLCLCREYLACMSEHAWLYATPGEAAALELPDNAHMAVFIQHATPLLGPGTVDEQPARRALHLWIGVFGLLAFVHRGHHAVDEPLVATHLRMLVRLVREPHQHAALEMFAARTDAS